MNLLKGGEADYIITGNFSKKAAQEAEKYGMVHVAYDGRENGYSHIPQQDELHFDPDSVYVHLCSNNTIYGTQWHKYPDTKGKIMIADMSSDILSRKIEVNDFGLIYAGAQKNIGIAGVAVVIIRKDLIKDCDEKTPQIFSYALMQKHDSMLNTPPTYPIYVMGKVLKWIEDCGGLEEIEKRNTKKARLLYDYLDSQTFYRPHSEKESRSLMNVTFTTPDPETDALFAEKAKQAGLCNLKGHRLVGGIRASIYNAMPIEGVEKLICFMDGFAKENSI
jgi:phosphoserine aminotransferase